jgi:iron complex transport system substrate-binding protein
VRGVLALALLLASAPAHANPPRIISLNLCTDQLLAAVAAPQQILGFSPFARDPARSTPAVRASGAPALSGLAEEVMILRPDLVVGGLYDRRTTHDLVRRQNIRLETFDIVRDLPAAREQITRMGKLADAAPRAEALAQELDAATQRLRAAASGQTLRVLSYSRRGWVEGNQSILGDLLRTAGLTNAAGEMGLNAGGFLGLEAIVKLKPDALVITRDDVAAEDQGSAMLAHPALRALFPRNRLIILPDTLTVCGGPQLIEAMDRLAKEIKAITPRQR